MKSIVDKIEEWNDILYKNNLLIEKDYNDIWENIKVLNVYKFNKYQPIISPPEKSFIERLNIWLNNFEPNEQPIMFYLSSKIIFITMDQYNFLIEHIYSNHIKKIILEDIIEKDVLIHKFDYLKAETKLKSELSKTLIVGLTDSSRINDFSHLAKDFDRKKNYLESLLILLYPTIQRKKYNYKDNKEKICKEFEKLIINSDPKIKDKNRLIILEDFSGTGTDIMNYIGYLEESSLNFEKIIIAPFVITFQAKDRINQKIIEKNKKNGYSKYFLCYGLEISDFNTCFDCGDSYLKEDWVDNSLNIFKEVENICNSNFKKYEKDYNSNNIDPYGFGSLKIAYVSYYNCPDNTLPIIWFKDESNKFNPLFRRSSRYI